MTGVNINSVLDPDVAETVALDVGCELDIKRPADAEEQVLAGLQKPDAPEDLVPRAPVVILASMLPIAGQTAGRLAAERVYNDVIRRVAVAAHAGYLDLFDAWLGLGPSASWSPPRYAR